MGNVAEGICTPAQVYLTETGHSRWERDMEALETVLHG